MTATKPLLAHPVQPIGRRAAMQRWNRASHAPTSMSTSDVRPPGVGPTPPGLLLARLGELPVGDAGGWPPEPG
jgi:hypothetical protein